MPINVDVWIWPYIATFSYVILVYLLSFLMYNVFTRWAIELCYHYNEKVHMDHVTKCRTYQI